MDTDINLLPGKEILLSREKVLRRQVQIVAVAISVLVVAVMAVVFLAKLIATKQTDNLEATYRQEQATFANQQAQAADIANLERKVLGIDAVHQGRTDYVNVATATAALVGQGVQLKNVMLSGDCQLAMKIQADNLSAFDSLLSVLSNQSAGSKFSNVVVSSFGVTPGQAVLLTLSAKYNK